MHGVNNVKRSTLFETDITRLLCSVLTLITEFILITKSQFTTNAHNVLHLNQRTHWHVWSWTVAHFQRSWGGWEWIDMHKKCFGEVSLYFQLELNALGALSAPTDKSLKDWDQNVIGPYLEN
jgi:hypothetical protein